MNERSKIQSLTWMAMAAAAVFVCAWCIKIPMGMFGYFNLSDACILLFSCIFTPTQSFLVAALSSALADVAGGYMLYAPFTFFIKGLEGLIASVLYRKYKTSPLLAFPLAALFMALGYFFTDWLLYGSAALALSALPVNILQGAMGCAAALVLRPVLLKALHRENYNKA